MQLFARALLYAGLFLLPAALPARAQTGWGLAPDGRGGFTFSDITRDRVWRADAQGHLRLALDRVHCHTLVPGYDGAVYGEDVGGGSRAGSLLGVWKLTSDGRRIDLLAVTLTPDPAVWLVRDAANFSYAWDSNPHRRDSSRILRRSPQGEVAILAGGPWGQSDGDTSSARFGEIGAMTVTPEGVLFIVDTGHLRRVSPGGSVVTLVRDIAAPAPGGLPGRGGLWNHSMGMAVDSHGEVYIVDYRNSHILRWEQDSGATVVFRSKGWANRITGGSTGWRPTGVAAKPDAL